MKCGFYELDITPSLGSIIPGSFEARLAPTSALEMDAGDIVTDAIIAMYKELK